MCIHSRHHDGHDKQHFWQLFGKMYENVIKVFRHLETKRGGRPTSKQRVQHVVLLTTSKEIKKFKDEFKVCCPTHRTIFELLCNKFTGFSSVKMIMIQRCIKQL